MRILWYTGVQLPEVTGEGLYRAGWQEGLRRALHRYHPEIQLAIASFGSDPYQPFSRENATYYNIYRQPQPQDRWSRWRENWKHWTYQADELERSREIYHAVNPDLVFIFGTENPFGLLAPRFSVPTVISIQAVLNGLVKSLFLGLSGRELLRELFSKDLLLGQGLYHRWWTMRKQAGMERLIYQRNANFCGRTDWDRCWMERLNPAAKYFHIDRVLGEAYYQAEWKIGASSPERIFSLSGNAPFKGGVTLVRSLARLKSEGRDDVQLHLAGVDPDSRVGQHISRLVRENRLEGQVSLLGRLGPARIAQEMLEARLFVLPSHLDNSPNSLAEAMLVGMPCLASNAGGIPSLLEDQVDGLLYNHTDPGELASRIGVLLADPGRAEEFGRNARIKALARHDPKAIAGQTSQMYRDVLSAPVLDHNARGQQAGRGRQ